MTRRELIDYCLTYPSAYEDYPFQQDDTAVVRHSGSKKSFALIIERQGELCINLKCEPMRADFLRHVYESIRPAWHMNKIHWNTIVVNGDVPMDELYDLIQHSFDLTKKAQ